MQQPQQHPAHQHGKYQHPQIQYLMKPEYNGENISICLQNRDLWKRFHDLTNEMIVTKAGRRMFPIVSISIRGLEPEKMYSVELSFEQIDPHRWRYVSGQWQPGTKPDPLLPRTPYQHPDSPNYGETWMRDTVVFSKVKLTNKTNQTGPCQVVLNSLHKYKPKLSIIDVMLKKKIYETSFEETEFIAVTAYQNEDVTALKIKYNPFAKAFLDTGNNRREDRDMIMLEEQSQNANNYVSPFSHHPMFFTHQSSPMHTTGPERLRFQSYRSSPYNYTQTQRKSSPNDGFQTKLDPYPTSSTSPFDPSLFYTPTTPASIPCSSSSPISPNTAAAAAYYSNTYYPTPTSYYFPYGTTPSPASHHPFMAPLTCPMNNGTSSSPLSPSFLHLQQPVTILPNVNNHSTSSSPKDHENLFNSSTTQTAASDVGQY
ncbi:unnamed protein product [Rotaria magnacalcarata]|uniref:T-box domain-containing protein n=1 Tax=Rotaria magnacalcarata TaxID=392030 RepID=A0A816SZG4_9BILA|nr:unnamed protein product [Rotaria magnacalcarata]CAF4093381.1 unnamed protein product [Rotaria magnacalcarata]